MTDYRKQRFQGYVRELADTLKLKDWEIKIKDGGAREGAIASIYMPYGQKKASLYFSEEFLEETLEEQRQIIIHELVHLHFENAMFLGKKRKGFDKAMEIAIDEISTAIATYFPLPPEESNAGSN